MKPRFFTSGAEFRRWLAAHYDSSTELLVGFYKKRAGAGPRSPVNEARGGLTYRDALDAALAYGWIDGVRRSVDAHAYTIRFTPRKKASYWSVVNTKRFRQLQKFGKVAPPGLRAFEARDARRTRKYSFERAQPAVFDAATGARLRANRAASAFFDAQPPGYRKLATYWVMSAKKEATRTSRLAILIGRSARGLRLDPLKPNTT